MKLFGIKINLFKVFSVVSVAFILLSITSLVVYQYITLFDKLLDPVNVAISSFVCLVCLWIVLILSLIAALKA